MSASRRLETPAAPGARSDVGDRVLVVGAGFLGSHLVSRLREEGVDATVLTRNVSGGPGSPVLKADVIYGDASDPQVVEQAIEGCTRVFWCAGGLLPADSNANPREDVALSLPPLLTTLEALRAREGIGVTFFSSGGTVYGEPEVLPVPETHPARPLSSYGIMKLAAERYLDLYTRVHGVPHVVLRCGNVYGPGQQQDRSQGLIASALARARAGLPIVVFGDGSTVRDFVFVDDVITAALTLTAKPGPESLLVNVGSGQGTSVAEVLTIVEAATGHAVLVNRRAARPGDVHEITLDTCLLQSLMPWNPMPLSDGVAQTWEQLDEPHVAAPEAD